MQAGAHARMQCTDSTSAGQCLQHKAHNSNDQRRHAGTPLPAKPCNTHSRVTEHMRPSAIACCRPMLIVLLNMEGLLIPACVAGGRAGGGRLGRLCMVHTRLSHRAVFCESSSQASLSSRTQTINSNKQVEAAPHPAGTEAPASSHPCRCGPPGRQKTHAAEGGREGWVCGPACDGREGWVAGPAGSGREGWVCGPIRREEGAGYVGQHPAAAGGGGRFVGHPPSHPPKCSTASSAHL